MSRCAERWVSLRTESEIKESLAGTFDNPYVGAALQVGECTSPPNLRSTLAVPR
jgi:hypothetical protein